MKRIMIVLLLLVFPLGCARVKVEAPKDPIKVDISMRLDIYQHVEREIDEIEDLVTGGAEEAAGGDQSFLQFFVKDAYAEGMLDPEVKEAALRRKARRAQLVSLMESGVLGENKSGLVEARSSLKADGAAEKSVEDENADRMVIYKSIAKENNITVAEVQKLYAEQLREDAPAGAPIEVQDSLSGSFIWKKK